MYSLCKEYIVPPFKLFNDNDVLHSAHQDPMASFDSTGSKQLPFSPIIAITRSLKHLTNALRIFNPKLCLAWS